MFYLIGILMGNEAFYHYSWRFGTPAPDGRAMLASFLTRKNFSDGCIPILEKTSRDVDERDEDKKASFTNQK